MERERSLRQPPGHGHSAARALLGVAPCDTACPGLLIPAGFDRSAGTPVDVLVNGTIVARGEVVVVDDELGVRVTEVIKGADGVPS